MKIQGISTNSNYNYKTNKQVSFRRLWSEHASWGANYLSKSGKTNFKLFTYPDVKAVFLETTKKISVMMSNMWERTVNISEPKAIAAATTSAAVAACLSTKDNDSTLLPMENKGEGVFEIKDVDLKPDEGYRFVIVNKDGEVSTVKDPYAKKQPNIHGWSAVYDSDKYQWKNTDWLEGKDPRRIVRKPNEPMRGLEKLIIDEVNIPTMSSEGTFEAAKKEIDAIAARNNATAIEIMPVENTYSMQWGYDGVDKFAVNEKLGGADALKDFVDYVHGKGLNIIIDMVPNHMGPDGDYLSKTGPYIKGPGEFGNMFNYEGQNSKYVRDWMVNAALRWANEFKADGIRFDLTSSTGSDWLLRQIVLELNRHNPNVFLIAEDHKHKRKEITNYYDNSTNSHENIIDQIEQMIKFSREMNNQTGPWSIGFDSEWDSQYSKAITNIVLSPNSYLLDLLDNLIKSSHYRVHYAYSHDEIGNFDGTRFVSKFFVNYFDLFAKVDGSSGDNKGQKAAHIAQKLVKLITSEDFDFLTPKKLLHKEKEMGLDVFLSHSALKDAFNIAIAKQKMLLGTIYTTPGPKMFFQGDDVADLSYFKFFRELYDDKQKRIDNPEEKNIRFNEKGYDPLEEYARPDSVLNKNFPAGLYVNVPQNMEKFISDLRNVIMENKALQVGDMIHTYKDNNHLVHIHHLKSDDNEILVLKNYGHGFHNNSYEYFGFPSDGSVWEQVFSSDSIKYGGMGYSNDGRDDITNLNQHLSIAPNSFIILKRVN